MHVEANYEVAAGRPQPQMSPGGIPWRWPLLILLSILAGWGASTIKTPAAWMIGPMLVTLVFSLSVTRNMRMPKFAFSGAQMVIGVLMASTFNVGDMPLLVKHWYAVLLVSAGTLLISILIGMGLWKRNVMDKPTALLGVLPGGASGMVAMSSSMSADPKIVALMQYVRLLTVVVTASLVTKWIAGPALTSHPVTATGASHASWMAWGLSLLIGTAGAYLGLRFRIPAGAMLGAMVLALIVNVSGLLAVSVSAPLSAAAYAAVGIYVGLLFDRASIVYAGKLLPSILLSSVALILSSAAVGWLLATVTPESFLTCFLATSPGGIDSVTLMALGSGANVALVVSLQTVRLFAIVFWGPVLVRRLK